jgi:PAS domain S-box-containing protein
MCLTDRNGRIVIVNDEACAFVEMARHELVGRRFAILVPHEARRLAQRAYEEVLSGGYLKQPDWRVRVRSGAERWIRVMPSLVRLADEPHVLSVLIDVTDPRVNEQALIESERRERERATELAALMDAVPAAVWIAHDPEASQITGSKLSYEMLQVPDGKNLSLSSPNDGPQNFKVYHQGKLLEPEELPVQRAAREGVDIRGFEEDVVFEDGSRITLFGNASPLVDEDGKPRGSVGAFVDITPWKRVQEQLARQYELTEALAKYAEDAIFLMDPEGRITYANPAAVRLFEYQPEEMLGEVLHDLLHHSYPDGRPFPVDECPTTTMLEGEGPIPVYETVFFKKDGEQVHVSCSHGRVLQGGKVIGSVKIVHDITDRILTERKLFESTHRLQTLFDNAQDTILVAGDDARYLDCNPAAVELLGYSREELLQMTVFDLIPSDNAEEAKRAWSAMSTLGRLSGEIELVHKDGRQVIGEFRAVANVLPGQHLSIIRDITERKQQEQALHEHARTLEAINRIGESLVSELDVDTLIQQLTDVATELVGAEFGAFFYNPTGKDGEQYVLYTLSGVPKEAFENFPMPRNTDIFGPTFSGEGVVRLDDVTQDPRFGKNDPYFGMPEGHLPVVSYLALPVMSRSGSVIGGLFFGHSATGIFTQQHEALMVGIASQAAVAIENARLYASISKLNTELEVRVQERTEELQKANREMEGFTYSVSHDLRAPLRAIMSSSMILMEDFAEQMPREVKGELETIERNSKKLGQLIDDLLKFSRLGRADVKKSEVDVTAIAREVGVALSKDQPGATISVQEGMSGQADAQMLQLVFENLIGNSLKYVKTGEPAQIEIGFDGEAYYVRDKGIGFDPEYSEKLFQPFERLHREAEYPGTGIGLANVKRIVERHGGQVWAESASGQGSTFYFTLP